MALLVARRWYHFHFIIYMARQETLCRLTNVWGGSRGKGSSSDCNSIGQRAACSMSGASYTTGMVNTTKGQCESHVACAFTITMRACRRCVSGMKPTTTTRRV
eukprot:scaffold245_cov34-Tisochrysis_lutea.AAC.3